MVGDEFLFFLVSFLQRAITRVPLYGAASGKSGRAEGDDGRRLMTFGIKTSEPYGRASTARLNSFGSINK